MFYTLVFLLLLVIVLNFLFPLQIPDASRSFSQIVLAKDGRTLRAYADEQGIWRQKVSLEKVSPLYLEALIAYEDRWFWYHPGINPVALLRAAWLNWQCDCVVSGGSTLTMQVARILHPHKKTLSGKAYQMLRALQLELNFSKTEILELYLNFAPFGGTVEGIEAASHAYLGKPSRYMTHAEAALMAVLPQSPSRIRPDRYPIKAQAARDKVLNRMQQLGDWSSQAVSDAKIEQVFADRPVRPNHAPLLSRSLRKQFPQKQIIPSSIDFNLQQGIENQIANWILSQPEKSSAAVLVVENATSQVRAYIGSANFNDHARFGHVDMVTAIRSPGSTLKPFIYGLAIDKGLIHSHSLLSDSPRFYSDYKPQNFAQSFSGPVSVTQALHRSLNVPAIQVLEQLGPDYFYSRMLAANIPMQLPSAAKPSLAMGLGGLGISLWDLVSAYTSLANKGKVNALQTTTFNLPPSPRFLMTAEAAWVVYNMLASNLRPGAVRSENILRSYNGIAWKTGTSYGFRDAWAIGTSKHFTIGVWLGRPDGTPQPGHFGALNAAPLLFNISDAIHKSASVGIEKPEAVKQVSICWPLGTISARTDKSMCHKKQEAWIANGVIPKTFNDPNEGQWLKNPLSFWTHPQTGLLIDLDCKINGMQHNRIALWPKVLEPWISYKYTRKAQIPKPDPSCKNLPQLPIGHLKITGLQDQAIFSAPSSASELPAVTLNSIGGLGPRQWYVNGKYIFTSGALQGFSYKFKQTGKHQFMVVDQQGDSDRVNVQVKTVH